MGVVKYGSCNGVVVHTCTYVCVEGVGSEVMCEDRSCRFCRAAFTTLL